MCVYLQTLLALIQCPCEDALVKMDPHNNDPPKGNPAVMACLREHFVRVVFLAHANLDGKESCWEVPDDGETSARQRKVFTLPRLSHLFCFWTVAGMKQLQQ